jgi:hypothetical protein
MELKEISPIEKVGYEKLKSSHWVSHTEIIIDASPEQVWSVLTDTKSYGDWNEIILKIDGEIVDKERWMCYLKQVQKPNHKNLTITFM